MPDAPFTADRLLLNLDERDKDALILRLCEAVLRAPGVPSEIGSEQLQQAAQARDEDGSTERISPDMVCLHLRRPDVEAVRIAIATLPQPIPWTDGQDVRFLALLASPRDRPVQSLRAIAQLKRLMSDPAAAAWIANATDPHDLAPWLDARLRKEDNTLTAKDLMRPAVGLSQPDMGIPELCKVMARHGLDAVGITDGERRLVGIITADDLFSIGMPDFFHQLESVSFLAEFDPFEKYFAKEQRLTAAEVMRPDMCVVPPDATVLEVVFQLAVKKEPKVFVCEGDRLVGVIDRIRVIDRILEP